MNKADIVLEGGGAKLPGLVGAYMGIWAQEWRPQHIAGTSAGSIVGALMAAGYNPYELQDIILKNDFMDMINGSQTWNLIKTRFKGLHNADPLIEFLREMLEKKGVKTFGDLRFPHESIQYRWKLRVVTSDITKEEMVILPDHAFLYGQDPDKVSVAEAIRMSISLPYYFNPVKRWGNYFVDGGILSNYPIWLFDSPNPVHPTFGFLLQEDNKKVHNKIRGPVSFGKAIIKTTISAHDKINFRSDDYRYRTIAIPTGDVGTTDFGISKLKKEWLIASGYNAATNFLKKWSWEEYLEWRKS